MESNIAAIKMGLDPLLINSPQFFIGKFNLLPFCGAKFFFWVFATNKFFCLRHSAYIFFLRFSLPFCYRLFWSLLRFYLARGR